MDGSEFAAALIDAIEAGLARQGDMVLTRASLKSLVREALDPTYKGFDRPASPPQLPAPPPEFPKLKVKYDRETGRPVEHVVCETIYEEVAYMSGGWYTRPMTELEEVRRMIECEN
jgi:hypothetical protein